MTTESPACEDELLLLDPLLDRALEHVDHLFLARMPVEVVALAWQERPLDRDDTGEPVAQDRSPGRRCPSPCCCRSSDAAGLNRPAIRLLSRVSA